MSATPFLPEEDACPECGCDLDVELPNDGEGVCECDCHQTTKTGIGRYRVRPQQVEALRFTGANFAEIRLFTGYETDEMDGDDDADILILETDDGDVPVHSGQWIVKRDDQLFCYSQDLFTELFEPVGEQVYEPDAETLASWFHSLYEELASEYGYTTRTDTAVPWSDVPDPNRSLMIAVAARVLDRLDHLMGL